MSLFRSKKPTKRTKRTKPRNENEAPTGHVPSFSIHFSISLWSIVMKAMTELGNHFPNCI